MWNITHVVLVRLVLFLKKIDNIRHGPKLGVKRVPQENLKLTLKPKHDVRPDIKDSITYLRNIPTQGDTSRYLE